MTDKTIEIAGKKIIADVKHTIKHIIHVSYTLKTNKTHQRFINI